jgi:cytochrome o ubiquinol oxidase subunit 3
MAVMMGQLLFKGITPAVTSRMLRLSLFWHFLDVIWIGVFTVVYLMEMI